MKQVLFLFFVFACVYGNIWWSCGVATDHIKNIKCTIDPIQPLVGKNITVDCTGDSDEVVSSGSLVFTAQMKVGGSWVKLPDLNFDICDELSCPEPSGNLKLSFKFEIPPLTPKTEYKGEITATDQNSQRLFCLDFDYNLE
eukprot:TRINITY_DN3387_c0_g1_i1.p1 TRINITY_DN3387_c0_g1~~TRINITY_DN3387_c0_g1_i1.p1  ORF type:complete len:141 (-),score=29.00 TRINITY_DN3387_c0_g1_i1:44-466(-)